MATLTVRNLDDSVKERLRVRAAQHGVSMEAEVRNILQASVATEAPREGNLADRIHALFAPLGGVDLELLPRGPMRDLPTFD